MIATHDDSNTRLAMTLGSLTLNDPAAAKDDLYEVNSVTTVASYDQTFDSDPATDGTEIGSSKRSLLVVRLDGVIRAQTLKALYDKKKALIAQTDPALLVYKDAANFGLINFDFSVPTADSSYASNLVPSRYIVRPRIASIPPDSEFHGFASFYTVELMVPEARRFLQTTSSLAGGGTLDNSKADYPSWPTITITMSGAGSATYTIQRTGTYTIKSLVLNLLGTVNTDVVVVDMRLKKITKNGTETPSLYVSGDFWDVEPTSQTVTITNGTNATTSTVWRRAFVA